MRGLSIDALDAALAREPELREVLLNVLENARHAGAREVRVALGKGDGEAAAAMKPRPKSLIDRTVQAQTDGELFWKITNGKADGKMPSFSRLPELQRWQLVLYLRALRPDSAGAGSSK